MPNHPALPLLITDVERAELGTLTRAGTTEQRIATRARIVLRAADGRPNRAIADELSVSPMTILLWRRRFEVGRLGFHRGQIEIERHVAVDGDQFF